MADITFNCPECRKPLRVDAGGIGLSVICPICLRTITIPNVTGDMPDTQPPPVPQYKACPYCGEQILLVAKKCKHCGEILDNQIRHIRQQASMTPQTTDEPWPESTMQGFTILSLLVPIVGFIIGGIATSSKSIERRQQGQKLIIWSIVGIVIGVFIIVLLGM